MAVSGNDNDEQYLTKCKMKISDAIAVSNPDFIVYVAGYDMLPMDMYGGLKISENTVI